MKTPEWRNIAMLQIATGNFHTAIACLLRAQANGEDSAEFHQEFAQAFWRAGDETSALREINIAWAKDKGNPEIARDAAMFLGKRGEYAGAAKFLEYLPDDDAQAKFSRALFTLGSGDWEKGWKLYEARFDAYSLDFPIPHVPLWRGNASLDGKIIWIQGEQGIGDQIQFSRYVPWLQAQGATVILDCNAGVADFAAKADIITRHMDYAGKFTVPRHPSTQALPDYYVPLLSLPARHRTTPSNMLESPNWYRKAASAFDFAVRGADRKKKIGLVWAGSKEHPGDDLRSMKLQHLLPLTGNDNCEFYSFQVGPRAQDVLDCGADPLIHGLPIRLWMQTAVALRKMDALVSVDTGCAHMAGALGVKTFLMVSTEPDWRWGISGETTPWYPSFKVIRQTARGDWAGVVRRVAQELEAL